LERIKCFLKRPHSLAAALAKEEAKELQASMQCQTVWFQKKKKKMMDWESNLLILPETMMFNQQDIRCPENAACCTLWGSYFCTTYNAKILLTSPAVSILPL